MQQQAFEQELKALLPHVPKERNYWFIRTDAGRYFEDFRFGSFIGIGWNEVPLRDINEAYRAREDAIAKNLKGKKRKEWSKSLEELIQLHDPENKRTKHTANQLVKFCYDISKGDVVVIPDAGSHTLSFGLVQDNAVDLVRSSLDNCPYIKRREIEWQRSRSRYSVHPRLASLVYTHQTLSDVVDYREYIDNELSGLYIRDGRAHLVLRVLGKNPVQALEYLNALTIAIGATDEAAKEEGVDAVTHDIELRSNFGSPGSIELIGGALAILALGIVLVGLAGGKATGTVKKLGLDSTVETKGLASMVARLFSIRKQREAEHKVIDHFIENNKIENPEELERVLKAIGKYGGKSKDRD